MTARGLDVLDASALLALLGDEPGADAVSPLIDGGLISSVNWTEVMQRYVTLGLTVEGRQEQVRALGLSIVVFSADHADAAARLLPATRHAGLSLGDRACLALAAAVGGRAVTADPAWSGVDIGVEIRVIR